MKKNGELKKGRKPKGGKIMVHIVETSNQVVPVTNIIIHLKCTLQDLIIYDFEHNQSDQLQYNPNSVSEVKVYNNNNNYASYDTEDIHVHPICTIQDLVYQQGNGSIEIEMTLDEKLKELKINLFKNKIPEKKSACFWCTYEHKYESCYLPKFEMDTTIFGYGSFCGPQCAAAYLMNENIDDSTKFERYHLLNQMYGKLYNYTDNIKPAPSPYYLLDRFMGNLTIDEYRKLLLSHTLIVIDKPMSRLLPELHEDNEEKNYTSSITNISNQVGMYKVKRQTDKSTAPSKKELLRDHFNLS